MENQLTQFDKRLISGLVSTQTADSIALIIEKPAALVKNVIDGLVAEGRKIYADRLQEKIERKKKAAVKTENSLDRERAVAKQKRLAMARESQIKKLRRSEPLFKTKVVDYSEMITVRIDHRTSIQVKAGADITEAKGRFLKTYQPYAPPAPENPWQKFKPSK